MGQRHTLHRLLDVLLAFPLTGPTPEEVMMSAFTDALANFVARAQADMRHLRDLLDQALATDVADQEVIAALRAKADQIQAENQQAIDQLNSLDLDPSFPAPEPTPEPAPEPASNDEMAGAGEVGPAPAP